MIPLTVQHPELIPYRQIPVLHHPFRKEVLCCGSGHTARKIANTITSSMNVVRQVVPPGTHPMISSRTKHIRSFTGEVISLAKDGTNDVTYLVRQGQQEVVEEDNGDRSYVVLVVISHPCPKDDEDQCSPSLRSWKFKSPKVGKATHELGTRKEAYRSWPRSIICFNSSADIEGERRGILFRQKYRAAS